MAFILTEKLREGKTNYLDSINTWHDRESGIKWVRESAYKDEILKNCYEDFFNHPVFWLQVIYDTDTYFEIGLKIRKKLKLTTSIQEYKNILWNTKIGESYVLENIDTILREDENFITELLAFAIQKSSNKDFWFDYLLYHSDLHLRYLVMREVINQYPNLMAYYQNNITNFFDNQIASKNSQITLFVERMTSDDVSEITYLLFEKGYQTLFGKAKEYLFSNYSDNKLAFLINSNREACKEEIKSDIDRYFLTCSKMHFTLYKNMKHSISANIISQFEEMMSSFSKLPYSAVENIYYHELGKKMEEYFEKYMDVSRSKVIEAIKGGSTSEVLRIGDYVLKLFYFKWSYEKIICPNFYFIVKNLEEDYVRDKNGYICAGLEIQPYLKRSAWNIDKKYFSALEEAIKNAGYFYNDRFLSKEWGDNVRLLDSYLDADISDPENVPEWFKEMPLVLIDRDRIYPDIEDEIFGRRRIRQIPEVYN